MSNSLQNRAPLRRVSDITPEEVAAHIREARRLRSKAVGRTLARLGLGLRRAFRREPARKTAVSQV